MKKSIGIILMVLLFLSMATGLGFAIGNLVTVEQAKDGVDGVDGTDGKSAYEIAKENGFVGDEAQWLASLKGADGVSASEVQIYVENGIIKWGYVGENESYDLVSFEDLMESVSPTGEKIQFQYVQNALQFRYGDEGEWQTILDTTNLVGGKDGKDGLSAFDIAQAVSNNKYKDQLDWLASLKGEDGEAGKSVELFFDPITQEIKWYREGESTSNAQVLISAEKLTEGMSAFEIANKVSGYKFKDEAEWIASLKGEDGKDGLNGVDGKTVEIFYDIETKSVKWYYAEDGKDSAQELVSVEELTTGLSAYDLAKAADPTIGSLEEWLTSLKGKDGVDGKPGEDGQDGKSVELFYDFASGEIKWYYTEDGKDSAQTLMKTEDLPAGLSAFELAQLANPELKDLTVDEWLESLKGENGKDGEDGEDGKDGREVEFQTVGNLVQWRYAGEEEWQTLIDLSLYKATYTVTFMVDGEVYEEVEVLEGRTIDKPVNPTKQGAEFVGWTTAEGEEWQFAGWSVSENMTLTAKWKTQFVALSKVEDGKLSYSFVSETEEQLMAVDSIQIVFYVKANEVSNINVEELNINISCDVEQVVEGEYVKYTLTFGDLYKSFSYGEENVVSIELVFETGVTESTISVQQFAVAGAGSDEFNGYYAVVYEEEILVK